MNHPVLALAMTALFVFVLVRRVRRSFGRQRFRPAGLIFVVTLMGGIATALLIVSRTTPALSFVGALGGAALGAWALSLTRFGVDASGRFYVPNGTIGLVVLALFFSRVAMRLWGLEGLIDRMEARALGDAAAGPAFTSSPGTMVVLFVLLGYYVTYYGGVLLRGFRRSPG